MAQNTCLLPICVPVCVKSLRDIYEKWLACRCGYFPGFRIFVRPKEKNVHNWGRPLNFRSMRGLKISGKKKIKERRLHGVDRLHFVSVETSWLSWWNRNFDSMESMESTWNRTSTPRNRWNRLGIETSTPRNRWNRPGIEVSTPRSRWNRLGIETSTPWSRWNRRTKRNCKSHF